MKVVDGANKCKKVKKEKRRAKSGQHFENKEKSGFIT